ncbi:MAG: PLDc N-terminal domain-containing protein [Leucobacter sp.]
MSFWSTIWDTIWWFLTIFVFVAYLMALFSIIGDLFRDRKMNGFVKALWLLFLIFVPFLTALAYLIFRGNGMGERAAAQAQAAQQQTEAYIRSVTGDATPAAEIARAKALLDSGAITAEEFAALKRAALAGGGAA